MKKPWFWLSCGVRSGLDPEMGRELMDALLSDVSRAAEESGARVERVLARQWSGFSVRFAGKPRHLATFLESLLRRLLDPKPGLRALLENPLVKVEIASAGELIHRIELRIEDPPLRAQIFVHPLFSTESGFSSKLFEALETVVESSVARAVGLSLLSIEWGGDERSWKVLGVAEGLRTGGTKIVSRYCAADLAAYVSVEGELRIPRSLVEEVEYFSRWASPVPGAYTTRVFLDVLALAWVRSSVKSRGRRRRRLAVAVGRLMHLDGFKSFVKSLQIASQLLSAVDESLRLALASGKRSPIKARLLTFEGERLVLVKEMDRGIEWGSVFDGSATRILFEFLDLGIREASSLGTGLRRRHLA